MYLGASSGGGDFRQRALNLYQVRELTKKRQVIAKFCYRERQDFEEAFSLLYDRYHERGFIPPNRQKIFFTPYQALPNSRICIARKIETKEILCTATLVIDSPLGLPSDGTFKAEIDKIRAQGRKLAEYTCLAAKNNLSPFHQENGLFYVFRLLYHYARSLNVTDLVISVHPKHRPFYEKILLFKPLATSENYAKLQNAPAVLEHLDLLSAPQEFRDLYYGFPEGRILCDFFMERAKLADLFELVKPRNMSASIFREFFLERTRAWDTLEPPFRDFFGRYFGLETRPRLRLAS